VYIALLSFQKGILNEKDEVEKVFKEERLRYISFGIFTFPVAFILLRFVCLLLCLVLSYWCLRNQLFNDG